MMSLISASEVQAPWARTWWEVPGGMKSMSPRPMS